MKEKILKIVKTYGVIPQLKYFQTEVFELGEAIINYENATTIFGKKSTLDKQHITEEIADVMVMLEQFRNYYGIDMNDISEIMSYKIDRQCGRIDGESNE